MKKATVYTSTCICLCIFFINGLQGMEKKRIRRRPTKPIEIPLDTLLDIETQTDTKEKGCCCKTACCCNKACLGIFLALNALTCGALSWYNMQNQDDNTPHKRGKHVIKNDNMSSIYTTNNNSTTRDEL